MKIEQTIKTPDILFHLVKDGDGGWDVWATLHGGTLPADGFIVGCGDSPRAALTYAVEALSTAIKEITAKLKG